MEQFSLPSPVTDLIHSESVTLTPDEFRFASYVGMSRHAQAVTDGMASQKGCSRGDGFQPDMEGALGECAVAKFLGVFWTGMFDISKDDVGPFQVRTVNPLSKNGNSDWKREINLLLSDQRDKLDRRYILCVGPYLQRPPYIPAESWPTTPGIHFLLPGWFFGRKAIHDDYRIMPQWNRPCFGVPIADLKPMADLIGYLMTRRFEDLDPKRRMTLREWINRHPITPEENRTLAQPAA